LEKKKREEKWIFGRVDWRAQREIEEGMFVGA
jgi:hypothetical protein